jgi:DNA gyrase inhibitor GyrI
MSSLLKKLITIISIVIFILFFSLLIAAWSMGMFSSVSVTENQRGPYYIVVHGHVGSYKGINEKIDAVSNLLSEKHIEHSTACGIFYDDPARTAIEDLQSAGGFIVADSLNVPSPFECLKIPIRTTCVATIEANPAIAGFKTYPALLDWINKYNFEHDTLKPTLELYYPNGIVEVELPILKKD